MRPLIRIGIALFGFLAVAAIVLVAFWIDLWLWSIEPSASFDDLPQPPAPDYSESSAWSALPDRDDPADLVPEGASARSGAPADAFYIHGTAYLGDGARWNGAHDTPLAKEMGDFTLANQATAFNGCCSVYAPRYRSASLHAFVDTGAGSRRALELAYEDVSRAFRYFIEHYSGDRPFVLAGHSQGSVHLVRLLEEEIAGTLLVDRLVVAYAIGHRIPMSNFESLEGIEPCDDESDTGCVVSFNAMRVGTDISSGRVRLMNWTQGRWEPIEDDASILCTHPYTWVPNSKEAASSDGTERGAMHSREVLDPFGLLLGSPSEIHIQSLPATFDPKMSVRCRDGFLFVDGLEDERFEARSPIGADGTLHLYEYNLFYGPLQQNAQTRVERWLADASRAVID